MKQVAAGLATLGRGEDKVLVHMTPGEVHGLQAIALAHGGSLTINPHTGLPEAGFLRNILPAIAAAAAVAFLGPAAGAATGALGMGAAGTGAAAGALTGALTNKENRLQGALMGGLGGYGIGGGMGAGMQSGLFGGTEAAGAGITGGMPPVPGNAFVQSGVPAAADVPASQLFGGTQLAPPSITLPPPATPEYLQPGMVDAADAIVNPNMLQDSALAAPTTPAFTPSADQMSMVPEATAAKPSFMQALGQQFPSNTSKLAGAAGIAGTLGAFDTPEPPEMPQEPRSTARLSGPVRRPYDPERNLFTDYGTLQPTYAAKGGEMRSVPQLEDGGFVLTKKAVDGMGGQREAAAGLGAIPIRGPGTGTSDSIPTTIDGVRPAKVSNGEAYVPRKRVKQAGGAKRLYALMRRAEQDAKRRSA